MVDLLFCRENHCRSMQRFFKVYWCYMYNSSSGAKSGQQLCTFYIVCYDVCVLVCAPNKDSPRHPGALIMLTRYAVGGNM